MLTMDLQTMLIGLAVFLVSALLIYLILTVSMRETTFEQVMEEQKRKQEAQLSKPKEPKKDKKKKFKKGKSNEKGVDEAERKDEKMVELELEPEFIDVSDSGSASTPPKKSKASGKKEKEPKPILINKQEKVHVVKEAPELIHRKVVPKDVVELKHERERLPVHSEKEEHPEPAKVVAETRKTAEASKPVEVQQPVSQPAGAFQQTTQQVKKESSKKKKPAREVGDEVVTETVEKVSTVKLTSAPADLVNGCEPTLKVTKKNKAQDLIEPEFPTSVGTSLLESVQLAQLSDTDIKNMVETLIGKLSNPDAAKGIMNADWTRKGSKADPMTLLRRQLEEKERTLEEEQQRNLSGNAKIKDLNQELLNERQKFASLAKLNQDQNTEIQAMQARMQETHGQHLSEVNHYRGQLEAKAKQANDSIGQIQRMKEENKILQDAVAKAQHLAGAEKTISELQQKVTVLDSALQQLSKQLNAAENGKKANESKAKQYEERMHEMEASMRDSQAMAQRYNEMSDELHKSEQRLASLNIEQRRAEDEKKAKDAQINEMTRHIQMNNSKLEEFLKNSQQKDAEIEGLRAELKQVQDSILETSNLQQSQEKTSVPNAGSQYDEAKDQIIAEKDEAVRQLSVQLEERLKELQAVRDDLNATKKQCTDLESEKSSALKSLDEKERQSGMKSQEENVELGELRKLNSQLEAELSSRNQELDRRVQELHQKEADVDKLQHESSSKSQELSRLVNTLLQKDAEVAKTKDEVEALRNDNAVLSECRLQCEELRNSLISLSEELKQKDARHVESEAHLTELREKEAKWAESEASFEKVKVLEARLAEKDEELIQARESKAAEDRTQIATDDAETKEMERKLEEREIQLKELRERETDWIQKEAQFQQIQEAASKMEAELSDARQQSSKREASEAEMRKTLEATETVLAEREIQLRHLQEVNAQVVETELQLMELRQKSSQLQKLNEKYGSVDELEVRMAQLAEKESKLVESEKSRAEYESVIREVEDELVRTKTQLEESRLQLQASGSTKLEPNDAAAVNLKNDRHSPDKHREVTVFTHVQEKSAWDMSKLVLDLDTKEAEIKILQSVLTEKEITVETLESDKARLMEMIENMQMELWAKEKQIETAKSNNKHDQVAKELADAKQAQGSLQAEVVHYQTILADTERILKELESNVDNEEQKWRQKYETAVKDKDRLQEELDRLQETHSVTTSS